MSRSTKSAKTPSGTQNGAALQELAALAAAQIRRRSRVRPNLAIVLGSGFEHLEEHCKTVFEEPYSELPGFADATAPGHSGRLLISMLDRAPVMILSGRVHYYEGISMEKACLPIRMLAAYGIESVLMTNAAGGIRKSLKIGDLMILRDHLNCMGTNPLIGWNLDTPTRYVDMSQAYDPKLVEMLYKAAKLARIKIQDGVYAAMSGPTYETPAEINALSRLGADAVGMSTVPEVIVARQCGLRVAALSCITNPAAGRSRKAIRHEDVLSISNAAKNRIAKLMGSFVGVYGRSR